MRKVSSFHYHLYRSTLGPDTQKVPDKKKHSLLLYSQAFVIGYKIQPGKFLDHKQAENRKSYECGHAEAYVA